MTGLTNLLCVWIEASIALVLASTSLEILLLDGITETVKCLIALGASGLEGTRTFEAVGMARSASLQHHVWILEIGAVINARTVLQEKAVLTGSALSILGSVATCAIGVALDAHVKVTCSCNSLSGHEVAIQTITLDDRIIAIVHAVGRRIKDLACIARQAIQVGRPIALFARGEAALAGISGDVVVQATFASTVAVLLIVVHY